MPNFNTTIYAKWEIDQSWVEKLKSLLIHHLVVDKIERSQQATE